jgi:hypothetical protein
MKVKLDKKRIDSLLEGNKVAEAVLKGNRKRVPVSGRNRLKFSERPGFMRAFPEVGRVKEFQERGYTVVTNDPEADLATDRADVSSLAGGIISKVVEYRDGEPVIGVLMETPMENFQAEQREADKSRLFGISDDVADVTDAKGNKIDDFVVGNLADQNKKE